MTCDEWRTFLHDYVLGDLNEPARELLARHAESCATCLAEARVLQFVDRRLRDEARLEPPRGLADRALSAAPVRIRRELWRVAAALLLAGGIGVIAAVGAGVDRLPEEIRSGPRVLVEAARLVPRYLNLTIEE
jgi:anti-sigma factor RsiW